MGDATAAAMSGADRAEAARYALLRRLAPSIRHNLVINLQPIGMIYEVLDRRLRSPGPDIAQVHESARKINNFARAALECCLNVVTWLSPEEGVVTNAMDGTRECTSLVATTLSFRGYSLRNNATHVPGDVRLSAMRNVLTAALLQATDERPPPAELELTTARSDGGLQVRLVTRSGEGEAGADAMRCYRSLVWTDVEALAAAEDVQVSRPAAGEIVITFPWARAAAA